MQCPDRILRSGRREALVVAVVWLIALSYSVTYCYRFGYGRTATELRFVCGIPTWVFWGVVAPWLACLVFSWWFSFRFITDDALPGRSDDSRGDA